MASFEQMTREVIQVSEELIDAGRVNAGELVVYGVSTSEVSGNKIGTAGNASVAAAIYDGIMTVSQRHAIYPVFQCCEHLNRALVVSRECLEHYRLTEVSAVPIAEAGGAMAAHAYRQLTDPVLAQSIQAHAAVDIGETLIGMHLRPVAVPFRPSIRMIGQARIQAAYTRPPLIGGQRAVYKL